MRTRKRPAPRRHLGGTTTPGDVVPYTFARQKVDEAWAYTTGVGITVGVVDTGVSVYQPQLTTQFTAGQSGGRTITYDYSDANGQNGPPPYHDTCGHGSKILGLVAAPRDGQNIVGAAYGASAYAVRAMGDPVSGTGQWAEIREGIRRAAEASDIVNMSFGWAWGNSDVEQTIEHFYSNEKDNGRRVLFIGAAGSSIEKYGTTYPGTGDVKWPASLPQVVAVTGTFGGTTPCEGCATGDEVEFAAYTLGETTGSNTNGVSDKDAIGKTSGGAALVSGIATLVWSRYPSWTRDQVLNRMRASTLYSWSSSVGYGVIDALEAVGVLSRAHLGGPDEIYTSGTYGFEIYPVGGSSYT